MAPVKNRNDLGRGFANGGYVGGPNEAYHSPGEI